MKKVLFVIGSLGKGGAERVTSKLCNYFDSEGHRVYIACLLSTYQAYETKPGISVLDLTVKGRSVISFFRWIRKLRKTIREINPDCIVSFAGRINILTLISSKRGRVIVSERNDPRHDGRSPLTIFVCKLLYRWRAKKIVFQTKEVQSLFWKGIRKKSVIIPNPISRPRFRKTSFEDPNNIIMVGRLEQQKNYGLAFRAFKGARIPENVKLHIYGGGTLRDSLIGLVKEMGIENRVVFEGVTDEPDEKMISSSIYVLSSRFEGMSNSLMEAMAIGLPCISTPVSGSNELICDLENGILLESFETEALSSSLELLVSDGLLREKLGLAAAKTMERYYDEKVIDLWATELGVA